MKITIDRAVVEQALEFLDEEFGWSPGEAPRIDALRAALAQEQAGPVQEPAAWRYQDSRGNYRYCGYVQGFDKEFSRLKAVLLYTAPPQREPLTEEEIDRIRADEREACAKVCDFHVARLGAIDEPRPALAVGICAAAIRARSKSC